MVSGTPHVVTDRLLLLTTTTTTSTSKRSSSSSSSTMAPPGLAAQRPDAHTQRYDRQLRLWASSGQASLEKADLLVIGANSLSAQILKNLVLPGIRSFTILDDALVDGADMGVNFFLQSGESDGKPAGPEIARLLAELNPGVKATGKVQSPSALLATDPAFFTSFSLVISVNQPQSFDLALSELLWNFEPTLDTHTAQISFIKVRSAGMAGEFKISVKELGIIETHPDSIIDLRLTRPFPQLEALADGFDLDTDDSMAHSHIPFSIILVKKLKEWKQTHGGSLPTTSNRAEFVALLNAGRQPGNADEENFDEAIAALGKHVWRPIASEGVGGGGIPPEVRDMFKDPACENLGPKSSNFWLMVRALKEFQSRSPTASLPLTGSLPDMKATSATYVKLQNVYRAKAEEDKQEFSSILQAVVKEAGVIGLIPEDEITAFVKHAGYLKLVRGRSERQRLESPNSEAAMLAFMDPVNPCTFQHHIAFLAADRFYAAQNRYPGSSSTFSRSVTSFRPPSSINSVTDEERNNAKRHKSETPDGADVKMDDAETSTALDVVRDETDLLALATEVAAKYNVDPDSNEWNKVEDAVKELVRSGYSSLPPTTALLGGVVAQEVIKLITRQYVPADNTVVYDGIQQAIGVFRI